MHAVVFHVDFVPDREQRRESELDIVVSTTRSTPGFIRGTWLENGERGMSVLLFASEDSARAVAANAVIPPEAAVRLHSVDVFAVARDETDGDGR